MLFSKKMDTSQICIEMVVSLCVTRCALGAYVMGGGRFQ